MSPPLVDPMSWPSIAVAYFTYFAVVSVLRPLPWRRRLIAVAAAAGCWTAVLAARAGLVDPLPWWAAGVVVPSAVLLVGYWMSGLFFVRPSQRAERWLAQTDRTTLHDSGVLTRYWSGPHALREFLEVSYIMAYPVVPAGAATLVLGATPEDVYRYWSIVLLAEFASYGMLPWLQTRPPRVLEPAPDPTQVPSARRLNLLVLGHGSIQANSIPSGHAAGAFACALGVLSAMPAAGLVFLLGAICITAGSVLGRYHFLFDALTGIIVAIASWGLATAQLG